jgi:hypothetical protein
VQVQGGQITATLPGLELPVGLDGLGKGVRVRLVAGDQALAQSPELLLQRFQPLWRASLSEANSPLQEFSAAGSLACGYWDPFDGVRRKLYCFDPATGNPAWSYDLPLAPRDVFVAGDGRVFVGGDSNLQARVLVLQGGTLLAQYDLSADFALVTALALEGDTLYVGGSRYVQAPCGSTTRQILRVRFAKYRVAGSSLTRLALHDPTPQDLQEITSPNGCTGSGDDYSPYNWSVTPALRLEGGKVYAVFSVGPVWTGSNLLRFALPGLPAPGRGHLCPGLAHPAHPPGGERGGELEPGVQLVLERLCVDTSHIHRCYPRPSFGLASVALTWMPPASSPPARVPRPSSRRRGAWCRCLGGTIPELFSSCRASRRGWCASSAVHQSGEPPAGLPRGHGRALRPEPGGKLCPCFQGPRGAGLRLREQHGWPRPGGPPALAWPWRRTSSRSRPLPGEPRGFPFASWPWSTSSSSSSPARTLSPAPPGPWPGPSWRGFGPSTCRGGKRVRSRRTTRGSGTPGRTFANAKECLQKARDL